MMNTDFKFNSHDELITIDEYIKLLKDTLNNEYFSNTPFKKRTPRYLTLIKKIREYGVPLTSKPGCSFLVPKESITHLIDKISENITIQNTPSYKFKKSEFKVEDLKDFISMSDILKNITDEYTGVELYDKIKHDIPSICIPFINSRMRFLPKKDLLTYLNVEVAYGNIKKIKDNEKIKDDETNEGFDIIEEYDLIERLNYEPYMNYEPYKGRPEHKTDESETLKNETEVIDKSNLDDDLITIEEYIALLKYALNNESFSNTPLKKGTQPYRSFIQKLKEYEIPLIRKPNGSYLISKKTITYLVDKILENITIQNTPSCKFKESEFKVEDLKDFISMSDILKNITNEYTGALLYDKISYNIPSIRIPFIQKSMKFFPKKDLLTYLDVEVAYGNIKKIKDDKIIKDNETNEEFNIIEEYERIEKLNHEPRRGRPIKRKTNKNRTYRGGFYKPEPQNINCEETWVDLEFVLKKIKNELPCRNLSDTQQSPTLRKYIKNNLKDIDYIITPHFEIKLEDVDTVITAIINDAEIYNIDLEDDSMNRDKYNISKDDITKELLNSHYVDKSYVIKTLGEEPVWSTFKKSVPNIKFNTLQKERLFRKEVVDDIKFIQDNGVTLGDAITIINKNTKIKCSKTVILRIIKNYEIKTYRFVPGFTTSIIILKEDLKKIEEILTEENLYKDDDLHSNMEKYINNNKNFLDIKFKETLEWYNKYIMHLNDSISEDYITGTFNTCSSVYDLLKENLDKELLLYSDEEIDKLFDKITPHCTDATKTRLRYFLNFLMEKTNQPLRKVFAEPPTPNKIQAYDLKSYFSVLGNIINFVSDKNNVLDKMVGVVGARSFSGALMYLLSHYTACWRAGDIFNQIPSPNLKLLGFDNAEEFLEWYKKDGNEFTEEMGRLICKDMEYQIKAKRATASKNDGKLLLYTSRFLYPIYGLVACICEVNRQRLKRDTLIPRLCISKVADWINRLDSEILQPYNGTFHNRRANKSFTTYISEKSEEWNLGIGYLMSIVARGHKLDRYSYNEVTKIYINKDVINITFLAFSSGIFAGAKYKFLDLLDDDFKDKNIQEKGKCSKEFPMTNYEIEITLETVARRKNQIDKFFKEYLTTKKTKRQTLKALMYSKNSYGKHEGVKCILRAYESAENGDTIDLAKGFQKPCIFSSKDGCIGCPLMIAEKYFLYELQERLERVLDDLTSSKSDFDKMIHLGRIKDLFFPIVREAIEELGEDYVKNRVNVKRMTTIYKEESNALKLKKQKSQAFLNEK